MALFRLFFTLAALCAALSPFSASAAEGAARNGKELFAFYFKAKIPGEWSSSSNYGYFWLSASPDEACAVTATLRRYEAPDEALLMRHDGMTAHRAAGKAPGYFFINEDARGWFTLFGETAFWLETRGQCAELPGILSSVEAVRDKNELTALRQDFPDSPDRPPYWGENEMPDVSAVAQALASQDIRNWLAFVTPAAKTADTAEKKEDDPLEIREYAGKIFEAMLPEQWTVTETAEGVTFSSPDGKHTVTAVVNNIPDQSDEGVLAFAREYRQRLGGKNLLRAREDRAGMENRYSFMLPGGDAVVFVDGRTIPARIVTYSDSELASTWENEMDSSLYVRVKEQ